MHQRVGMADPKDPRVPNTLEGFRDDGLYGVDELAMFIGQPSKFVRKLVENKRIQRAHGVGRRVLFLGSEIKRFVRQMRGEQ